MKKITSIATLAMLAINFSDAQTAQISNQQNPWTLVYEGAITENIKGKVNIHPVTYKIKDIAIVANVYTPPNFNNAQKYPAIVIAHPNGGVKEQVAGLYAQRLAEQGFVTITADAAYQGGSGGTPRNVDKPANRIEDIYATGDFIAQYKGVDAANIGLLGICGGGGYSLKAAQTDKRFKAIATVSMFNSGVVRRNGFMNSQTATINERLKQAADARALEASGGEVLYAADAKWTDEMADKMPFDLYREGHYYYNRTHAHPNSTFRYTMSSLLDLMAWDASTNMDLIDQPLLMIAGSKADTYYMTDEAFGKATNAKSKELFLINGATHIETYWKPEYVSQAISKLLNFYQNNLSNPTSDPIIIHEQGSFSVGGTVITNPGTFDPYKPTPDGQTFRGDHAYIFYQIPEKARKLPLVMWHGIGQFSKTYETTPDGREGFQNIFLRRNYGVYLLDQPRRGDAGRSTVEGTIKPTPDEQQWFGVFRVGIWPNYFEGVQFARDTNTLNQYFRSMTPNIGPIDINVNTDAASALFDKIGPAILVTHSHSGGMGWITAVKNQNVKAIVSYEPGSGFLFPEGEVPAPMESVGGTLTASGVPMSDFMKLTKIPIIIYYGDNIPEQPSLNPGADGWRVRLTMARLWRDAVNKHGGDVTVVHLPEIGIRGNTHFPFSDLNNLQIADLMSEFLKEKGLDK